MGAALNQETMGWQIRIQPDIRNLAKRFDGDHIFNAWPLLIVADLIIFIASETFR